MPQVRPTMRLAASLKPSDRYQPSRPDKIAAHGGLGDDIARKAKQRPNAVHTYGSTLYGPTNFDKPLNKQRLSRLFNRISSAKAKKSLIIQDFACHSPIVSGRVYAGFGAGTRRAATCNAPRHDSCAVLFVRALAGLRTSLRYPGISRSASVQGSHQLSVTPRPCAPGRAALTRTNARGALRSIACLSGPSRPTQFGQRWEGPRQPPPPAACQRGRPLSVSSARPPHVPEALHVQERP